MRLPCQAGVCLAGLAGTFANVDEDDEVEEEGPKYGSSLIM